MEEVVEIAFMHPDLPNLVQELLSQYVATLPITLTNGDDANLCAKVLQEALEAVHGLFLMAGDAVALKCEPYREMAP